MNTKFVIYILIMACVSCKSERVTEVMNEEEVEVVELEFDKDKWQIKKDGAYVFRDKMYKYILYDKEVRALSKDQILSLLGAADKVEANHYYYTLNRNSLGLMILNTKTLVIKFSDEDTIEWIKVHG